MEYISHWFVARNQQIEISYLLYELFTGGGKEEMIALTFMNTSAALVD
jgi:hypothetical protein